MWKLLPLLFANLRRRRVRTVLTIASVATAFLLFGLLEALRYGLLGGVEMAGADRLMTMHKVSFIQPLPRNYLNRIQGVEGVRAATALEWFGGTYQTERNQIPAQVADPETLFEKLRQLTTGQATILQLIYQRKNYESNTRDYEFSADSMHEHWQNGLEDTRRTMKRKDWLKMPPKNVGIVTHDVHRNFNV